MNDFRRGIEQFILGALIQKNDNFDLINSFIDESDFYTEIHKEIYKFIHSKLSQGKNIEISRNSLNLLCIHQKTTV